MGISVLSSDTTQKQRRSENSPSLQCPEHLAGSISLLATSLSHDQLHLDGYRPARTI